MAAETPEQMEARIHEERVHMITLMQNNSGPDSAPSERSAEEQAGRKQAQQEARRREEESASDRLLMMQRTPQEVKDGYDPTTDTYASDSDDGPKVSPISAAQMRGTPVRFDLGDLHLLLRPLKRRDIRDAFLPKLEKWPEVLQFAAAVKAPKNTGIDAEATAFLMSVYRASRHRQEETERERQAARTGIAFIANPAPDPVTPEDVEAEAAALTKYLDDHMPVICATTWLLAEGTPGLAWPRPARVEGEPPVAPPDGCQWLDDYLDDNLFVPEYADLLRGLLVANGSFTGSTYERFAKP